eukprot:m51a1_g14594 hypothetical protein (686) ;mRNA; r:1158602-1161177
MAHTYSGVQKHVEKFVPKAVVTELIERARQEHSHLWALREPAHFVDKAVYLVLFKDLKGVGYGALHASVLRWMPIATKSFTQNQKILCKVFARWGHQQICWSTFKDQKTMAKQLQLPKALCKVTVAIDSVNFPKPGTHGSDKWSFKENCPAGHFMVALDMQGRPVGVWGPYSPKLFDSHWIQANKKMLKLLFPNDVFIADNHFAWAQDNMKTPAFFATYACPPNHPATEGVAKLLVKKRILNRQIEDIRSRVESPFGVIKENVKAVGRPFAEKDNQLENITLRSSNANEVASASALSQLRLGWPSGSQMLLLQAGVPRLLLGTLEAHPDSEPVTVSALRVMPSVCIRVVAGNPQRSPGVFVSLARAALVAMRAHPQSCPVQQAGCEALVHIARTGQAVCDACVAEGAVECVASALSLSQKLGPLELPIAACEALELLCTSSRSARERVLAPGAVETLVRMVAEGEKDSKKTLSACEVLGALVRFVPQGREALGPIELRLFSAAAATLARLVQCRPELRDTYEEERCLAVGAVVLILRRFGQDRSVELAALQALTQLANKLAAGPLEALVSRLLQPDVGQVLANLKKGACSDLACKCLSMIGELRVSRRSTGAPTALKRRLRAVEEKIGEMERVQERLQRVARENEAAREEIARLKAGLEACKDAPERLAELQHAYDLLLHTYYSC